MLFPLLLGQQIPMTIRRLNRPTAGRKAFRPSQKLPDLTFACPNFELGNSLLASIHSSSCMRPFVRVDTDNHRITPPPIRFSGRCQGWRALLIRIRVLRLFRATPPTRTQDGYSRSFESQPTRVTGT